MVHQSPLFEVTPIASAGEVIGETVVSITASKIEDLTNGLYIDSWSSTSSTSYTISKNTKETFALSIMSEKIFTNGVVTINLPQGFEVTADEDYIWLSGFDWRKINSSEISSDGRTITISGINNSNRNNRLIVFLAYNDGVYNALTIPEGDHVFNATIDSDNSGVVNSYSVTLISQ